MRRCLVVIPAHDEEASIADVVRRVPRHVAPDVAVEVLVVDDGSTDATRQAAFDGGAEYVFAAEQNLGLGSAIRFGLKRAAELGADFAVMLDADGEYPPEDLPTVLAPLLAAEADYVLGSRFSGGPPPEMRPMRKLGNRLFTALQRCYLRRTLQDGQTGMRAFNRAALDALDVAHSYNYAQVLTLNLVRQGFRLVEVPVGYKVRQAGASFISWRYLFHVPLGILREAVSPPAPRGLRSAGDAYRLVTSAQAAPARCAEPRPAGSRRWGLLATAVAAVYGLMVLKFAFAGSFVVEPDARQHVFWMARYLDPGYFPGDPIADYLQAVAPPGYAGIYRALAWAGVDPLIASKILPPVLGIITAAYTYALALRVMPVPPVACMAAVLVMQHLWTQIDLISGTPRAFMFPVLLAFLFHLVRGQPYWVAGLILLEAAVYPQFVLVMAGVLVLWTWTWRGGRPTLILTRLPLAALGLLTAGIGLAPYALQTSGYTPVITASEAWAMAEFHPEGTKRFFNPDPLAFWISGHRSGAFSAYDTTTPVLLFALLLPWLLRWPQHFPLAARVTPHVHVLSRAILAALGVFFLAHLVAFKLYLPNRYANLTLGVVLALGAALAIAILAHAVGRRLGRGWLRHLPSVAAAVGVMALPEALGSFPRSSYQQGAAPAVYRFLQTTPLDTLVMTIAHEGINLPTFARRPVLAARGFGNPYHLGFYRAFRARSVAQLRAHYTPSLDELRACLERYGVDYVLVDRAAFHQDYLVADQWLRQLQPAAGEALHRIESGIVPALARIGPAAEVQSTTWQVLLSAEVIRRAAPEALPRAWPVDYWYR